MFKLFIWCDGKANNGANLLGILLGKFEWQEVVCFADIVRMQYYICFVAVTTYHVLCGIDCLSQCCTRCSPNVPAIKLSLNKHCKKKNNFIVMTMQSESRIEESCVIIA